MKLASAPVLATFLIAAAPTSAPLLREQAWTAASATFARDLVTRPAECLSVRSPQVEIGRALFRSPNLLGGPAARIGLSCNACHNNGRTNARFFLPELTDRAGAADVSSEWSSKVRGDGAMNPVGIPDLVGVGAKAALARGRDPSLEHFVQSVIVEEFQGPTPPAPAFAGLIAYLRALDQSACPAGEAHLTLASAADDVRRAVAAAEGADRETAALVLLAGQDLIGRIVERLPARRFARERARLEAMSRELAGLRGAGHEALNAALPGWRARFDAEIARLTRRERQTYFNERTLARALSQ